MPCILFFIVNSQLTISRYSSTMCATEHTYAVIRLYYFRCKMQGMWWLLSNTMLMCIFISFHSASRAGMALRCHPIRPNEMRAPLQLTMRTYGKLNSKSHQIRFCIIKYATKRVAQLFSRKINYMKIRLNNCRHRQRHRRRRYYFKTNTSNCCDNRNNCISNY